MDPFELLKKDHKKVSGLLNKLEQTEEQDSSIREELFHQIKNELDIHSQIEETIFYPALKQEEETKEIALEAYEEHSEVKRLLQEMSELDTGDETWGAKATLLKENIEHHVEEEEGEMFKKAKKALEREELEELGDQMMRAKAEGRSVEMEKDEDLEDEELAGAGSRTSTAQNAGATRSNARSRGSAARSSGSRSRSKSSVKSARKKGSKKKSSSKKSSRKSSRKK